MIFHLGVLVNWAPLTTGSSAVSGHIKKGMEEKLLGLLYKRYVNKHGHGIRNLDQCAFIFLAEGLFVKDMPELRVEEGNRITFLYLPLMNELESKGMVRKDNKKMAFFFTEEGYRRAAMGWWDKALDFCNRNAGLAVVVAVCAAVISLGSLVVAIIALNSTPASPSPASIKSASPRMEPSRLVVIDALNGELESTGLSATIE
ncbi:hypothetical protein SHV42_07730 [Pseudomonas capeferrum]|uniref:hypothetical protein n=1 Tax=Pseudomonas capeferrum TaxID=1495066 RepID=UPI00397E88CE